MLCVNKHSFTYSSEVYYHSLTKFYIYYRILFKRKKSYVLPIHKTKKTAAVSATHNTLYSLPSISCTDYTFFKCLPKVDSIKKMICISKNRNIPNLFRLEFFSISHDTIKHLPNKSSERKANE